MEQLDSCKLSSDLHTHTVAHVHTWVRTQTHVTNQVNFKDFFSSKEYLNKINIQVEQGLGEPKESGSLWSGGLENKVFHSLFIELNFLTLLERQFSFPIFQKEEYVLKIIFYCLLFIT